MENAQTTVTPVETLSSAVAKSAPTPIRKKRAPRHDFKDGCGKVAAHRHDHGKGWVADTARVDDSVYVGPRAAVFQFARVCGGSRLEGNARVFGHARISDNVLLKHNAAVYGQAEIIGAIFLSDNVAVHGSAKISGECTLRQKVEVCGRAAIFNSVLSGNVSVTNDAMVLRSRRRSFKQCKCDRLCYSKKFRTRRTQHTKLHNATDRSYTAVHLRRRFLSYCGAFLDLHAGNLTRPHYRFKHGV